jgi:hypothetical protein
VREVWKEEGREEGVPAAAEVVEKRRASLRKTWRREAC